MVTTPLATIEEPPIVLRRNTGSDLEPLLDAVPSSSDHLKPWLAWASVERLEPGLRNFASGSIECLERGDNFDDAIWDPARSNLIGGPACILACDQVGSNWATGSEMVGKLH
jgi:hypothetical protein